MPAVPVAEATAEQRSTEHGVVRNTLYLTFSQAVTVPLAVLINALTARYWGRSRSGTSTWPERSPDLEYSRWAGVTKAYYQRWLRRITRSPGAARK